MNIFVYYVCGMFIFLRVVKLLEVSMMLDKKLVKPNAVAVFLLILIVFSFLACLTSEARKTAVLNMGLNGKNIKRSPSSFRHIKPSCNSRNSAKCGPPPKRMDMNMSNANETGAEKRVVPTGPNPLHNR